jgi:MBG domain
MTDSVFTGGGAQSIGISASPAIYDGQPHGVSVQILPLGPHYNYSITYNGSTQIPTNVGVYNVLVSVQRPFNENLNASAVFYILKKPAQIAIVPDSKTIVYDGNPHQANVITTPANLSFSVKYNGGDIVPVSPGVYNVVATINDSNYQGTATGTITITGDVSYYFKGGDASNVANWYLDSGYTTTSTILPNDKSIVYIDGNVTFGNFICNHLIVGKFSSSPIALDVSWLGVPYPHLYWPSTWEFYNNSSVSQQIGLGGLNGTSSVIVHYPNAVPFNSPEIITSYVGFPYIIQVGNLSIPYGTLSIIGSTYGSVAWSVAQNLKEGDDWIFFIQFHSGKSLIDPQITQISCSFNDAVTGESVFDSSEFISCIFVSQDGFGNTINQDGYLMHVVVESQTLQKLLGSYKDGVVAIVPLLGEIQWHEVNNTQVGPNLLTQRSQNFQVTVSRSLNAPADFLT